MSIRTRKVESATPERPGMVEHRRALRGGSAGMWIAVIVALLVGLAGGYSLGRGLEPTRTVTKTVTETVAPPAYTTSHEVQARVTFDGSTCAYSGPAEVAAGTRIAFDYTAVETVESAMAVARLPRGMTYEDMVQAAATGEADNPPPWAWPNWDSDPAGAPNQSLTMPPLDEGLWVIVCGTSPETTNEVFLGTMIRAV